MTEFDPWPLMQQVEEAIPTRIGRPTPPPQMPAKLAHNKAKVLPARPRIERLIIPRSPSRPTTIFRMAAE